MYGYEIAATVHRDTDGAFTWREGSLYPSLHKMEQTGLIVGAWEEKETGRKRRYYRITEQGQAALQEKQQSWTELCRGVNAILDRSFSRDAESAERSADLTSRSAPQTPRRG